MKTIEQVLVDVPPKVFEMCDFSQAHYTGALRPITGILCSKHGVFQQYAAQLRKGSHCPECGAEKRVLSKRLAPSVYIERARDRHSSHYSYDRTEYVNMTTKVVVSCPQHGDFSISPIKHLFSGQGCPQCGARKRGYQKTSANIRQKSGDTSKRKHRAAFEKRAHETHGNKYTYHPETYDGMKNKMLITCSVHGDFWQGAYDHAVAGKGCPRCSHHQSKAEDEVATYLARFTKVIQRDRTLIGPKEIDIYLPEHNLAVEYCGMYWHSHGDKDDERKNKQRHAEKHRLCEAKGIRLITIYETEWAERTATIKRMLRNAVGATRGRLMARKCDIGKPTIHEARAFYEKYHPQGGSGTGEHYGLYHKGKLVACMRFSFGNNDRGAGAKVRQWTLSRYATRLAVAGAASRLFKAFVKEHDPSEVKSFSDNRLFGGAMYAQLGFGKEADVVADYQVWSPKLGLRPKPHYQRRALPIRLKDHGSLERFDPATDKRTEGEMTYLMGARRIFDCGKKRWVWLKA